MLKKVVNTCVGLGTVLSLAACSKVAFAPSPGAAQGLENNVNCGPNDVTVTVPTKTLFLVDQSGSNVNGPYDDPGKASDPTKSFRSGVISSFFASHRSQTNVGWSFVAFNGSSATSLMPTPGFGNADGFSAALAAFSTRVDVGDTPYRAALQTAHDMIQADLASANPAQRYLIAFITDGYPTDYCPGGPSQLMCPGKILENQIHQDVAKVTALLPGMIQFSTVYYGLPDPEAQNRLNKMAQIGGGQFVNANIDSNIDLNDSLVIPETVCH